jgi:hypothetical protein
VPFKLRRYVLWSASLLALLALRRRIHSRRKKKDKEAAVVPAGNSPTRRIGQISMTCITCSKYSGVEEYFLGP